jgi:tripartite-type tricarboxylate transporter receptor subunit TctC
MKPFPLRVAFALCALCAAFVVRATEYPARPVRLVSPYAPGGSNDIVTRVLAQKLSEILQQPVYVENRPGGGMTIASEMIAHGPADGYALLLVSSGHAVNPSLRSNLPYDTLKDFAPIGLVGSMPNVVVVNPRLPIRNVAELVDYAKARAGGLDYASAGNGSSPHLAAEWFKSIAHVPMTHIPYKGTGQSITDIIAGNVALTICGIAPALPFIKSGQLRAIALGSEQRTPLLPGVPTVAESGYPGYNAVTWYGIVARAGTPQAVIETLNQALRKIVAQPDTREQFAALGIEAMGTTPAEFETFIVNEINTWSRVVRSAGMKVD